MHCLLFPSTLDKPSRVHRPLDHVFLVSLIYKTDLNKNWAMDSGGRKKLTKSDDGWLTGIDKIYHRNSVQLISAKYRFDAKCWTWHSGVIYVFSNSFAEKVIKCHCLCTMVFLDGVFPCQNPWPTFCLNQSYNNPSRKPGHHCYHEPCLSTCSILVAIFVNVFAWFTQYLVYTH